MDLKITVKEMIRMPARRVKRQRKTKIQQKKVQHLQQQSRLQKLSQVKHLRRRKPQQRIHQQVIRSLHPNLQNLEVLRRQPTLKATKLVGEEEEEEEERVR